MTEAIERERDRYRRALEAIAKMPYHDQDNEHRMKFIAKMVLKDPENQGRGLLDQMEGIEVSAFLTPEGMQDFIKEVFSKPHSDPTPIAGDMEVLNPSSSSIDESKRGTGRTTRMMKEAIRLAANGESVLVIVYSILQAKSLNNEFPEANSYGVRVVPRDSVAYDFHHMILNGGRNWDVVFVDHYVIERELAPAFDMWRRWDLKTPDPMPSASDKTSSRRKDFENLEVGDRVWTKCMSGVGSGSEFYSATGTPVSKITHSEIVLENGSRWDREKRHSLQAPTRYFLCSYVKPYYPL